MTASSVKTRLNYSVSLDRISTREMNSLEQCTPMWQLSLLIITCQVSLRRPALPRMIRHPSFLEIMPPRPRQGPRSAHYNSPSIACWADGVEPLPLISQGGGQATAWRKSNNRSLLFWVKVSWFSISNSRASRARSKTIFLRIFGHFSGREINDRKHTLFMNGHNLHLSTR